MSILLTTKLFRLPRAQKRLLQLLADSTLMTISYLLALFLRLDEWGFVLKPGVWAALGITLPVSLFLFVRLGFYRAVIRYISGKAFRTILLGISMSAVFMMAVSQILSLPVPRSVPFIYGMLAVFSIGGIRFVLRHVFFENQNKSKLKVIIYGAGTAGRQLLVSFSHGSEYSTVAFVDDAHELHGQQIQGVKVFPSRQIDQLVEDSGVKMILLAMPSVAISIRSKILKRLEPLPVHVRTVPSLAEMISGKAKLNELREVALEDLLGRDPVPPRRELMEANIRDKVVLVSGAGGSIGGELCRQILRQRPKKLVLFEVSEFGLYRCEQDLLAISKNEDLLVEIIPVLGSVQNQSRVDSVLRRFGIQTIFHAAAYKHVPMVEQNIVEGIRNNVFGTLSIVEAAAKNKVSSFTLISTDKAVRPTNIMGASKRMAELICQAYAIRYPQTIFSMVRFGNVLGSSGSVIPLFHQQIANGGPITVTHPEITRYFMTIPEASQLVIQASAMAVGGEVFVLNMGDSVKIVDLAVRMAKLHGLNPRVCDLNPASSHNERPELLEPATEPQAERNGSLTQQGEISIVFSGLRPGEKLYEELLISGSPKQSSHPLIMVANENKLEWSKLEMLLGRLSEACDEYLVAKIVEILVESQTGYAPGQGELVDYFGA